MPNSNCIKANSSCLRILARIIFERCNGGRVMFLKRLLPVVALCLFFCGQSVIVTSQAYAFCCRCGAQCRGGCTCPGTDPNCPWCAAPDPVDDPLAHNSTSSADQSLASDPANPEVDESLLLLMQGSNDLGNALACLTPDEKYAKSFAFQATGDREQ